MATRPSSGRPVAPQQGTRLAMATLVFGILGLLLVLQQATFASWLVHPSVAAAGARVLEGTALCRQKAPGVAGWT
jgi:hypothetical protein